MGEDMSIWRPGQVIDGRYEVTGVHGQGGMGLVYRVRHLGWGIDLAVKSPRPDLFRSPDDQRRFADEAETWVSLGLHPHVCGCYYVRLLGGVPRVFAEYVPGGSLQEWIRDGRLYTGAAPEALIVDIAIQTAWGLDHAHGRGLVHQDVKPANVLLDTDATAATAATAATGTTWAAPATAAAGDVMVTAKITDFGLAQAREVATTAAPGGHPGASVPVPGGGMTPLYASPEQALGLPLGRATDVYSLAVSVLEMCAGEATWMAGPFAGGALAAYRAGELRRAIALPPGLGALLERCLREDPAGRPRSMSEVAAGLIDIYRSITGRPYPRPAPVAADLLSDELNNRAESLLDLGRHTEADAYFAQALAADPQNVRAIYNAGLARWRRGAVTDAAFLAEIEATRADTGDPWEARFALAQIHLERGDLGTARAVLGELAERRPDELEVREALRRAESGAIVDARRTDRWPVAWRHEGYIVPLALTPDGRSTLTGERDGMIRLYDVTDGRCVRTLDADHGPAHAVDITPDGRFAASVHEDATLLIWDLTKASPEGLRLPASPRVVRLTPDGRLAIHMGEDGALRVADTGSGRCVTLDEAAGDGPVAVSADGRRALSTGPYSSDSRTTAVRLWDLAGGRCELELAVPGPMVTALCLSPDGRFAAIAAFEEPIYVWDLAEGVCEYDLECDTTPDTLALSAGARLLLTGGKYEDTIRLWEPELGRCLRTFPAHPNGTTVAHLGADGRTALSAGQDGTVRRWRLPGDHRATALLSRPRPLAELAERDAQVEALTGQAQEAMEAGRLTDALGLLRRARAVEGYERAPRVMAAWWALGRRAVRTELRAAWSSALLTEDATGVVDLSADGRVAVSADGDGTIRVWDVQAGTCRRELQGHEAGVGSVRLSDDGRWVLSSSRDGTIRLWDAGTGDPLGVLTVSRWPMGDALPVRFSADGRQAVLGVGRLPLWDLETGDLTREAAVTDGTQRDDLQVGYDDLCVGGDGGLAATTTYAGLRLWDLGDGRIVRDLPIDLGSHAGTVSLSGDLALTGGQDGLRLWDTATGEVLWTAGGPETRLNTVRMTADGRFAVTGGVWSYPVVRDARTGRVLRVLDGHEQGVRSLAMTPDGRFVLVAGAGGLRLWELDWELDVRDSPQHTEVETVTDDCTRHSPCREVLAIPPAQLDSLFRLIIAKTSDLGPDAIYIQLNDELVALLVVMGPGESGQFQRAFPVLGHLAARWNAQYTDLLFRAMENMKRDDVKVERFDQPQSSPLFMVVDQGVSGVAQLVRLHELIGDDLPNGALVGIPRRHQIVAVPIHRHLDINSMEPLLKLVYNVGSQASDRLSLDVFWYHEGRLHPLHADGDGNGELGQIYPPDEFIQLVERLRGR